MLVSPGKILLKKLFIYFNWRLITTNKASGGDGIPVELFQILKDDALKVLHSICQQIWKTNSGHRTGKGQFSFQSQKKVIPKNVQTNAQLHSSQMPTKQCSKFSNWSFNSTWTTKFQMFKLVLEKAEEPEIKLPTSTGSSKKQESSRETSTSALLTIPKPLTVWITTNCGKFWKRWEYLTTLPASWEICIKVKSNSLNQAWNNRLVQNWERSMLRLYIVTLLI